MIDPKIHPLIEAIKNPAKKNIPGLKELRSEDMVTGIHTLTDIEILDLATERPGHSGQFGFILNPHLFSSYEEFTVVFSALMERCAAAQRNKAEWEKYLNRGN